MRFKTLFGVLVSLVTLGGCSVSDCMKGMQGGRTSMAEIGPRPNSSPGHNVLRIQNGLSGFMLTNARLIGSDVSSSEMVEPGEEIKLELGALDDGVHVLKVDILGPNGHGGYETCGVTSRDVSLRVVRNNFTGAQYIESVPYVLIDSFTPLREPQATRTRHSSLEVSTSRSTRSRTGTPQVGYPEGMFDGDSVLNRAPEPPRRNP